MLCFPRGVGGGGGRRAHEMRAVVLLHNGLCDPSRTAAAARSGKREMVELLLGSGADRSMKNKAGETAWDIAKKEGFEEIVKLFEAN